MAITDALGWSLYSISRLAGEVHLAEQLTAEDIPHVARMCRDLVEFGFPWTWTPARVAEAAENFIVAKKDEDLVGFIAAHPEAQFAHIDLIAVRPENRREGIGRQLVLAVEEIASRAGQQTVVLETLRSGPFFEALGYHKLGTLPGLYYGRDGAVYGKEI